MPLGPGIAGRLLAARVISVQRVLVKGSAARNRWGSSPDLRLTRSLTAVGEPQRGPSRSWVPKTRPHKSRTRGWDPDSWPCGTEACARSHAGGGRHAGLDRCLWLSSHQTRHSERRASLAAPLNAACTTSEEPRGTVAVIVGAHKLDRSRGRREAGLPLVRSRGSGREIDERQ